MSAGAAFVRGVACAIACACASCGGLVTGEEKTARTTPGTYGDPASDGGAASDASTTQPDDRRLVPLATNRIWTFDVTPSSPGATPRGCDYGTNVARVVGVASVNGETAFRYRPLCTTFDVDVVEHLGTDETIAYAASGQGEWTLVDAPVEEGHTWSSGGLRVMWRDAGSVTVRAGTFHDCWRRETMDTAQPEYIVYCRGVGQVLFHVPSDGYDAELVSKSF